MVPLLGPIIILVRDMFWHPTKVEIQEWVDSKALEFAREESEGLQLNLMKWFERYLDMDIHEIFFYGFPILLDEWLLKLETQRKIFQGGEPTKCNPQLIRRLKSIRNP